MLPPAGEASDEQLAARCQTGDYAAFEKLYQRYQRPILAYIYQITRNYEQSACIAQDVFIRVFEHVDRFDTQRRFSTWFYTIARNAAIDYLQSHRRKMMVNFTDIEHGEAGNSIASNTSAVNEPIEDRLSRREASEHLAKAVANLPLSNREIIELIVFQGLTYEDASVILGGISLGTLRSRMFHALRRMRHELSQVAGENGENLL